MFTDSGGVTMFKPNCSRSRRSFLKAIGTLGAGSVITAMTPLKQAAVAKESPTIAMRPFGRTGAKVSILSLGGVLRPSDQLVFKLAYNMGVTYWDTADSYGWGKNEKAIGKYFEKNPDVRKNVFLVTKAASSDPAKLSQKLNTSLKRMNTDYIDLYFIHYVTDVRDELTPAVKAWAEKAKAAGKIRFFGFSTHKNMENCMLEAAKLGWIDGIMMSYNYRIMGTDEMKRAMDACVNAGIGLTAMKTQAAFSANFYASIGSETDSALQMTESFMAKGYTPEQAKLKVVWENPHIASICSAMPNVTILQANVAAALNKTKLSEHDKLLLEHYSQRTAGGYCAGCAHICESLIEIDLPISDLMRCGMYAYSYRDRDKALSLMNRLPVDVPATIDKVDYSSAEKQCPQKINIGKVLKQILADIV
jgi:aryl-alcohol dehydrogenase-like predicted oxidoreductase